MVQFSDGLQNGFLHGQLLVFFFELCHSADPSAHGVFVERRKGCPFVALLGFALLPALIPLGQLLLPRLALLAIAFFLSALAPIAAPLVTALVGVRVIAAEE
jgi:hypothetical protein